MASTISGTDIVLSNTAGNPYLKISPGTVVASQSPWDPTGNGVNNIRSAFELKYETLYENFNEFALAVHIKADKGRDSSARGQPGGDKVAFIPSATSGGDGNNGSLWALNPMVNAYAGSNPRASYIGAEYDLNNFTGKHFGDTAPLEDGGNFIGIMMTGIGASRMTAGFMLTNPIQTPHQWNYGFVVPTDAISAHGSTFADFASGHTASIDIRGNPDFGIRQVSGSSRNWLNGRTLIGDFPNAEPQSRLHVEGGAVGGGIGASIQIFRRNAVVDDDRIQMCDTLFRIVPLSDQNRGADTTLYRTGLSRNGDGPAVYIDHYTNGTWSLSHLSAGSSITAYPDLRVRLGGNVDLANIPTSDPHVPGRVWRNGASLMISLG